MPKVKLFGLVLIITSLLLGMVVIATQTYQIRIYSNRSPHSGVGPVAQASAMQNSDELLAQNDFVSVPVFYPLGVACALGSLMWFVPGSAGPPKKFSTTRTHRNRRR